MKKRIMSTFLSLALIISSICAVSVPSYALEDTEKMGDSIQLSHEDLEELPQDISAFFDDNTVSVEEANNDPLLMKNYMDEYSYTSIVKAALEVRDKMINRIGTEDGSYEVKYVQSINLSSSVFNEDTEIFKQRLIDIWYMLLEMTYDESTSNDIAGGDYLRANVYTAGLSYKYDTVNGSIVIKEDGTFDINFNLYFDYYTTRKQEKRVEREIQNILPEIIAGAKNDFEKILAIHDFICDRTSYDYEAADLENASSGTDDDAYVDKNAHTAYGLIFERKSVCQGYAGLFYLMCKEIGIDARIILNNVHGWNIVKLGNFYYNVDCTWDDELKDLDYPAIYHHTYFLKSPSSFANDHIPSKEFTTEEFMANYPMAEYDAICPNGDHLQVEKTYTYYDDELQKEYITEYPDCTTGYNEYEICAICSTTLNALFHGQCEEHDWDFDYEFEEASDCTDQGYRYYKCKNCLIPGVFQYLDIDPNNHVASNPVEQVLSKPSCLNDGALHKKTYCTKCGIEITGEDIVIPATGHYFEPIGYDGQGSFTFLCINDCDEHRSVAFENNYLEDVDENNSMLDVNNDGFINAKDFAKLKNQLD